MRQAVIVEAVRTPVGKRNGGLAGQHPIDLSGLALKELVARAGVEPAVMDDVGWGCVSQAGDQASNVGRNAVLAAGWPESIPGTTVSRACGSSRQRARELGLRPIVRYRSGVVTGTDPVLMLTGPIPATDQPIRMINHMRDRGIRYGLQTMCEGGGTANATLVELAD